MRCVMARVLPVPAPASTHMGPFRVLATSRCSASRPPRIRSSRDRVSGAGGSPAGMPGWGCPAGKALDWKISVFTSAAQSLEGLRRRRRSAERAGAAVPRCVVTGTSCVIRAVLDDAAVPVLDQGPGDREPAGDDDFAAQHRFLQLGAAEPARPGDLDAV